MCYRLACFVFSSIRIHSAAMMVGVVASAADPVDYVNDVYPIFEKHCIACHTEDERQGGLVMQPFDSLMLGGDSGAVLTPGVPSSSRLFLMASGKLEPVMPPEGADPLGEDELAILAAWIEQGAIGPEGDVPMRRELRVPEIQSVAGAKQPVTALAIRSDGVRALAQFGRVTVIDGDGEITIVLPEQPGKVNSVVFSGDGQRVLVASGVTGLYGRAAIHDVASGDLLAEMVGHDDAVQTAIFSPDERHVATASYDHRIILWDVETATAIRTLDGHNGAVLGLAFSNDSSVLVSGSADETVKVWHVESGRRLDTMSQSEGEVMSVAVTPDGSHVVAGSADNRLRVWRLVSLSEERINPLVTSRFVDESPLTHVRVTADGSRCVVIGESGNVKVFSTVDWTPIAVLEPLGEVATDLAISHDDSHAFVSLIGGRIIRRDLPPAGTSSVPVTVVGPSDEVDPVYVDVGPPQVLDEAALRQTQSLDGATDGSVTDAAAPIRLPRGAEVTGVIGAAGEEDWFAWDARAGEMWVVETDTAGLDSRIDTIVEVRDAAARPIVQTRLQAVRDSYFTFRGKDSTQTGDFRVFAWQEMKLGEYFYASGEVNRLWLYPRGADSGYDVFPGMGSRWTYFGTSGTVHALGEPAYIVRPLASGEPPLANGLPVFEIFYENDDEPTQTRGKDSYVIFKAPQSGRYLIKLRDTRGEGGDAYRYRMRLRPADPRFTPSLTPIGAEVLRGSGREFRVMVDRADGFDGAVTFEVEGLPEGVISNFPITIEAGQRFAVGNVFAPEGIAAWEGEIEPIVTARATINHRLIERRAGSLGKLRLADRGNAVITIHPDNGDVSAPPMGKDSVIQIRRGETISLVARADRKEGFVTQIALGNEQAGRNLPFGTYVDNIGLNGLLIRENESERQFFITADETVLPGRREFFLTGAVDGGVTTGPVTIEVLP